MGLTRTTGQVSLDMDLAAMERRLRKLEKTPAAAVTTQTIIQQASGGAASVTVRNTSGSTTLSGSVIEIGTGLTLASDGGVPSVSLAGITVEELDGSPTVTNVTALKVTNGTLTDNGDGSVTITITGGTTPTGTGFPHITAGVQDAAARAVDVSSADCTGTLAAGRFPALTGDITTSAGSLATTLKNTGPGAISAGDASHTAAVTLDAQGRVTALSAVSIQIAESQVTNLATDLAAKTTNPMTATGDLIYSADNTGTPARRGIGSTGQVLSVVGGVPTWGTVSSSGIASGGLPGMVVVIPDGAPASTTPAWDLPLPFGQRFGMDYWEVVNGNNTRTTFGPTNWGAFSGTIADGKDTTGNYLKCTSGSVSGNAAGQSASSFDLLRRDWHPDYLFVMKTDPSAVTTVRYYIGMVDADVSGLSADPTTQNVAAFRYDTGLDTAGQWSTVTCDGSGTATVTKGVAAIASNTKYILRIVESSGQIDFYINGAIVASHTTHLPTSTQLRGPMFKCVTLTAAGRAILLGRFAYRYD